MGFAEGIEEILDYRSDITVLKDGSMRVQETIAVNCQGNQIRHGIYRDFPTTYRDAYGNRYRVGFVIERIQRDGVDEDYHLEKRSNGQRVYIGSQDVFVQPGLHTYTITYLTDRQLGFFKDHDELYWNVTGNGWVFPIRQASARVHLPTGISDDAIRVEGYTGSTGSRQKDYTAAFDLDHAVRFETVHPLGAYEGLTIVVSWPKGFVEEPTARERLGYFLRDNMIYIMLIMGLFGLFGYYLWAWNQVGRDPKKGTIIPRYQPPDGLTPAALRFIAKMGFDHKALTCAVIDLGVKGAVDIIEDDREHAIRKKTVDDGSFSLEEAAVYHALPEGILSLKNTNYLEVESVLTNCKGALASQYEGRYFKTNTRYLVGGIILTVGFWAGAFAIGKFQILAVIIAALISLGLTFVFYRLLKAPSAFGRRLMDQIEGFKMFLATAEKERLNVLYPSGRTPQLFEEYLPYALALDVEQAWADRFDDVLARASADGTSYRPAWYYGNAWSPYHAGRFASHLGGAFSHAIAASAVPPGSSSGSGGGGFSGGGGGGGGGGGW